MPCYLYLITSHKRTLDAQLLKLLIDSLVFSHLYYALPVWGPSLNQQLSHILCLQNKAVCFIKKLNPRDHDHLSQYYQQLRTVAAISLPGSMGLIQNNMKPYKHRILPVL